MAELSVGVLGLGRVGASFALALARYSEAPDAQNQFTVTAYDSRPTVRGEAKRLKVADSRTGSIAEAVAERDLILVDVPTAEARRTFRELGANLRDGAVVLDMGAFKTQAASWAREDFPAGAYLVGGIAVVNPALLWDGLNDLHHARADLFDEGAFLLAPSPSAAPEAVDLVTKVAELIGAKAHFVDAAELEGLTATTEGLPALLGVAAFRAMASSRGWSEIQRATNPNFGRLTHHLLDTHPDDLRDELLGNRENLVHQLDRTMAVLSEFREALVENDADTIEAALVDATDRYENWLKRRTSGRWDTFNDTDNGNKAMGSMLSGMLGGFLADRIQGKDNDKR